MAWKGVITNSGSELLAQWTAGKTLTITRAAAGTGRVSEAAMLAQTALVSEKQTVSILSNKTTAQGQKLQLQVTPLATGYPLNQLGIWAKLDSGAARLIALFQTDTDAGVEIPSKTDVPDYVYTFYGLLEFTGSGGTLQVTIDASALVTAESMADAIKAHNEDENAHEGIRQAITDKQDKITASGILRGDGKGGTGQLPVNTPGGVAGLGADGKMDTDQLPINVPNGIPTLGPDGKLSADSLPQVGMTAQIVVTAPTGSTVTATLGTKVYTATESGGKWTFDVEDYGTYTIKATKNGQTATDTVTVSVVQQYTATLSYFTATIHVSIDSGSTVTCTKGSKTQRKTASATGTVDFTVTESGTYTITATKNGETAEDTATITADGQTVNVKLAYRHIYGVVWDGTSTTVWSRTDEAASFVNPTPYRAGATNYGSPFDNLYPWSGMVRVTDAVAGELVAIPKFWYKWTKSGNSLKLQIADKETDGFHVSPAHADRGDGKGERDIVYIGRYHCNTNNYKSQSGVKPKANITRSTARTSIHNLGSNIWQSDIQMRMTIWMLYLVEFADWNSQKTIGKGCGNNSATENMGYTDSMPYHTGTTLASRDSYGLGTQYRYIEGLWDNVYDWGDGCYYNSNGLNIINTPSSFSDNSGGTAVGVPSSGWPSAFTVATVAGLEWVIYPTASGGSETTYSADSWYFDASYPCLFFGGSYSQSGGRGLFCVDCAGASSSNAYFGCRLQKLP